MSLMEKLDKRFQWYEATTNKTDAAELSEVRTILASRTITTDSEAIKFLRQIFDNAECVYTQCVVSNIAEILFRVHFPKIEGKEGYRPKIKLTEAMI